MPHFGDQSEPNPSMVEGEERERTLKRLRDVDQSLLKMQTGDTMSPTHIANIEALQAERCYLMSLLVSSAYEARMWRDREAAARKTQLAAQKEHWIEFLQQVSDTTARVDELRQQFKDLLS